MIRLLLALLVVPALAQDAPSLDVQRRTCAISLGKAEADLAQLLRSTYQMQAAAEVQIEDLKARVKELEDAKQKP